jgi:GTPase
VVESIDVFIQLNVAWRFVIMETITRNAIPIIALVGRPNVGKSTLFNRLTRSRAALVADYAGLTRDRQYGSALHANNHYIVVDTGGLVASVSGFAGDIEKQAVHAIYEADVVILLVDAKYGVLPQDKIIANQLRLFNKIFFVAANKTESDHSNVPEFYSLGNKALYPIAAEHGHGIDNLMDAIFQQLPQQISSRVLADQRIKFAIVGRPNVGKSTLVNAILGEERMLTCNESGTTRDSVYSDFTYNNNLYTIIDTAGLRRKTKITHQVEQLSTIKAIRTISAAEVVLVVLDAQLDIATQDETIIRYAINAGKSIVVVINKWDSINMTRRQLIKAEIKIKLHFLSFAHFCYISALHKSGINDLMNAVHAAYSAANIKMPTPKVSRILQEAILRNPPAYKGLFRPKLRYAHQGGLNPPTVIIHGSRLDSLSQAYTQYLSNIFSEAFGLVGTTVTITYKNTENPFHLKRDNNTHTTTPQHKSSAAAARSLKTQRH